jgi:hypothetical protein
MKCVVGKLHVDTQRRQLNCGAEQRGLDGEKVVKPPDLFGNRVFLDLRDGVCHLFGRNRKVESCPTQDNGLAFCSYY